MNILIDADGCPVVDLTLQIAKQFSIPVIILCDTSHQIERKGAQTLVFDKGADSVDFALVNRVKPGDLPITKRADAVMSTLFFCLHLSFHPFLCRCRGAVEPISSLLQSFASPNLKLCRHPDCPSA